MTKLRAALLLLMSVTLSACGGTDNSTNDTATVDVNVSQISYESGDCSGQFVAHPLPHTTVANRYPIEMFDSNGAGMAVNDLDQDGDLDLVFANLGGKNSVLWNEGNLKFRSQELEFGNSRAAATVDVDNDGWLDLVFTTENGLPLWWKNTKDGGFSNELGLPGVKAPAYSMAWSDLDQDGDLDLVAGSYDAALEKDLGDTFLNGDGAGIYVYTNNGGEFMGERLIDEAQALAIQVFDVDGNGKQDILIGNDFAVRDYLWLNKDAGWERSEMFNVTTHSTMSFALADLENDGQSELFATDMIPYKDDAETQAEWQPVMDMMMHGHVEGDPQVMANVLQSAEAENFNDVAEDRGVLATGWSWSGKFGDLDQDGFVDLYVVNGMRASELFSHLPNNELVEENQAFANNGDGTFEPVSAWMLGATDSGRGMSMADVDGDGDLDILVNNLETPAQLFENQLCEGTSVKVALRQAGVGNMHAVGAEVTLETNKGTLSRLQEAGSGYLSGDPAELHFGMPEGTIVEKLTVTWPDGSTTVVDTVDVGNTIIIER